jgi:hypothetical protein
MQHAVGEDAGGYGQACSVQPGVLQLSPQQQKVQRHDRDLQQDGEVHRQLLLLIELWSSSSCSVCSLAYHGLGHASIILPIAPNQV